MNICGWRHLGKLSSRPGRKSLWGGATVIHSTWRFPQDLDYIAIRSDFTCIHTGGAALGPIDTWFSYRIEPRLCAWIFSCYFSCWVLNKNVCCQYPSILIRYFTRTTSAGYHIIYSLSIISCYRQSVLCRILDFFIYSRSYNKTNRWCLFQVIVDLLQQRVFRSMLD